MNTDINITTFLEKPTGFHKAIKEGPTDLLYQLVLECQTRLCLASTIQFLSNNPLWQTGKSVLDAGCGPGEWTQHLSKEFTDKTFHGIDRESNFIDIAKKKNAGNKKCSFETCDILEYKGGPYDTVFLYAVMQHIGDAARALKQISSLVKVGGSIFILDDVGGKSNFESTVEIPTLKKMYDELAVLPTSVRNKNLSNDIAASLPALGLTLVQKKEGSRTFCPSELCPDFAIYSYLVAEMLERFYEIKTDLTQFHKELTYWLKQPNSAAYLTGEAWWVIEKLKK